MSRQLATAGAPSAIGDEPSGVVAFSGDQLRGFRLGVTSDRRSSDLIAAFTRRGAEVVHAPTIRMSAPLDDGPIVADTAALIAERPDTLLATTSFGMRRWFEVVDAAGLGPSLFEVLSAARILVRGPKARGALRAGGLDDDGMSEQETTESLVDRVVSDGVVGRTIALQLHGATDLAQLARLEAAGARVVTVAPYQWQLHEDQEPVDRLIAAIVGGGLDAVTFTSAPAVDALFVSADRSGQLRNVIEALSTSVLAATVGPVTAAPLIDAGIVPLVPDRYRMGAMIRQLCEHLEDQRVSRLTTPYGIVELRGRLVELGNRSAVLAPVSLSIFRALIAANGATLSRSAVAGVAPEPLNDHAIDAAVSRLRRALPEPRLVATVVKRGFRIAV